MSNFASVEEAVMWMAEETGKNAQRDRTALLTAINDARRLFYTIYQKVRLDFYIEGCAPIQEFCQSCLECPSGEPGTYLGIALPPEVEQVETLHNGIVKVPLYDKWFEYRTFIRSSSAAEIKGIDMGGDYPLPSDVLCGKCATIRLIATDKEDCGKVVTIRYYDAAKEERLERLALTTEGVVISTPAKQLARPGGIVLPVGIKGAIMVQDCADGRVLGQLSPRITVPSFRRRKLTCGCVGDLVAFRGTRKFTEVYWDWEVIEVGGEQKLALLEAYRYNKLNSLQSSDPSWSGKAKSHLENVTQYIAGSNMRSDGATVTRRIDLPYARGSRRSRLLAHRR